MVQSTRLITIICKPRQRMFTLINNTCLVAEGNFDEEEEDNDDDDNDDDFVYCAILHFVFCFN